jgi:hypothetical protein
MGMNAYQANSHKGCTKLGRRPEMPTDILIPRDAEYKDMQ